MLTYSWDLYLFQFPFYVLFPILYLFLVQRTEGPWLCLNVKNTINLPKCFALVILSAFSHLRMSYKLISKINISEYKHSHNLSKALYIKRIALSCQTSNLIKILSNHFDKGEKSTWSISKCEYICISNDSTCPEQYKQEYCSKQYVCYAYKKTYSYCLLKAGHHRNQEPCVWNCFSCNRKILPMEKKFAYELAYGEFKYIYSHVITN